MKKFSLKKTKKEEKKIKSKIKFYKKINKDSDKVNEDDNESNKCIIRPRMLNSLGIETVIGRTRIRTVKIKEKKASKKLNDTKTSDKKDVLINNLKEQLKQQYKHIEYLESEISNKNKQINDLIKIIKLS